jgi:peptide/nickel transport system permease protein
VAARVAPATRLDEDSARMVIVTLIVKRLGTAVVTLLVVSAIVFFFTSVLPGDIAERVLGHESTPQQREIFRERLHLNRPVYDRYGSWIGGVLHGNLGRSLVNDETVSANIGSAARNTLFLSVFAFLLYVPVTLVLATLGAVFRGKPVDSAISVITLVGLSIPDFVLGTLLIFVFAVKLSVVPALSIVNPGDSLFARLDATVLPAVTLMVAMAVYAIRMLRDNLIDVLDSEYVRMATLKGVPRWRVVCRHALPNAVGPALNVTALNLTYLIGGVVVVETVFSYPGLGKMLVDAISVRDVPVVEAIALLAAAVYILANLVADVLALLANPRLRTT